MAVLYSNIGDRDGETSGNTFYLYTSPPEGTTSAIITSVKAMFYEPHVPYGPGTLRCGFNLVGGGSVYSEIEDFTFDEAEEIVDFSFDSVNVDVSEVGVLRISLGTPGDFPYPYWTIYKGLVDSVVYVEIQGEWVGDYPPSKPTNPTPANADTEVDFSGLGLSWDDGGDADTFDVYIGPSGSLVKVSDAQVPTSFGVDLEDVPTNQVIYWRVDATNDVGTTTGDTWYFDARPAKVATMVPADEASDIALHSTSGSWTAPSANTTSYNVYYGTLSGFLSLLGNTEELSYTLKETNWPNYGRIHYWRVDAINDFGVTAGDEFYFTCIFYLPPLPSGVTLDEDGDPTGTPNGENNIYTIKRLIAASNNKIWFEDVS